MEYLNLNDMGGYEFVNGKLVNVPSVDEICEFIKYKFDKMQLRYGELSEENCRLKNEAYKDEEIARLKAENDRLREECLRGFPISEEQEKAIKEWQENHKSHGYKYEFFTCAIGVGGSIIDDKGNKFTFQEL